MGMIRASMAAIFADGWLGDPPDEGLDCSRTMNSGEIIFRRCAFQHCVLQSERRPFPNAREIHLQPTAKIFAAVLRGK